MMPHTFYDLDAPVREDASVFDAFTPEGEVHGGFETFRELLAFRALWTFKVDKLPQQCEGSFAGETPDILPSLDPVLRRLGFRTPIPTGSFCGLYERADAVLICKSTPRADPARVMGFFLGGSDARTLRRALGAVATESPLEVEVDEWTPALP
ncbi:hypothetical protein HPC49_14305 [Pyxidicoccus fallax]|uniref:Uncharacterized protein n=2 Tax=Pyxidicoccus fallax TaxID=394095 RepID=A0A848L9U2_9BACT|nr:hypothetical protein [Pyxidicoccus fallax]NPC79405.1 hypothetical protein [Pyxidicoccus fallax]